MNRLLSILIVLFMVLSQSVLAYTAIAPESRLEPWIGQNAMPDTNYTIGTTSAMGTVKTLKANLLTDMHLASLDMTRTPGAKFQTKLWYGSDHQSVSDKGTYDSNGTSRQCVAFARSMTGVPRTTAWARGTSLMEYLIFDGVGYKLNPEKNLVSGTMIAHFQGKDMYPQTVPWGHVATFLYWTFDDRGYADGIYVVDQNLVYSVSISGTIITNANGLIQKHPLPLFCTAGKECGTKKYAKTFFSGGYHVVDVQ